jgi:hypothetical protein
MAFKCSGCRAAEKHGFGHAKTYNLRSPHRNISSNMSLLCMFRLLLITRGHNGRTILLYKFGSIISETASCKQLEIR